MLDDDDFQSYSPDLTGGADEEENNTAAPENRSPSVTRNNASKPLLEWMDINISEPERRYGVSMKMQETYMVYLIETRIKDAEITEYGDPACSVWRRYSEFELLRNYLDIVYPAVIIPPLPEKRMSYARQNVSTDRFDTDYIERRRAGLETFLLRCAAHSELGHDKILVVFLRQEDGWKDVLYSTGYQMKADSLLSRLSAGYRIRRPDRRIEELKNYSSDLQSNISNILKMRAKLCDKVYGIHKVHANYGRVFSEWSGMEKEMGDGLQSAGHFLDVYASSIDSLLEDEEQFADQLKEYYAYSDALRSVCRKHEIIELDLEKLEDGLSSKKNQKNMLVQGKTSFSLSGMKSRLFGSDPPEVRDQKIKQLEEQIDQTEAELRLANQEAEKFLEDALNDIDRFKKQKVSDLKDAFTNYAVMQIERCKKGIAVWQNTKECFANM
ncbi:sorting nexin-4-like isoform X2 [Tubulanus polymorphus]|uniref:sorting nexin-4-like isoform X2 n=1 Tax=Tubulanus polymorphus TaxID=672921 RepID=UPI003DA1EE35